MIKNAYHKNNINLKAETFFLFVVFFSFSEGVTDDVCSGNAVWLGFSFFRDFQLNGVFFPITSHTYTQVRLKTAIIADKRKIATETLHIFLWRLNNTVNYA